MKQTTQFSDYLLKNLNADYNAAWLGLYDPTGKCNWEWLDGTRKDFFYWNPGQPLNCNGQGWTNAYVVINPDTWNNVGFRKWGQAHFDYGFVAACVRDPN